MHDLSPWAWVTSLSAVKSLFLVQDLLVANDAGTRDGYGHSPKQTFILPHLGRMEDYEEGDRKYARAR